MPEPIHDRKDTHGHYEDQFSTAQQLKRLVRSRAQPLVDEVHLEALEMICLKMSRILTGDPSFVDHWEDIAGYSLRVIGK